MFKEKLIELRKLNNDTQDSLANKLYVSLFNFLNSINLSLNIDITPHKILYKYLSKKACDSLTL